MADHRIYNTILGTMCKNLDALIIVMPEPAAVYYLYKNVPYKATINSARIQIVNIDQCVGDGFLQSVSNEELKTTFQKAYKNALDRYLLQVHRVGNAEHLPNEAKNYLLNLLR